MLKNETVKTPHQCNSKWNYGEKAIMLEAAKTAGEAVHPSLPPLFTPRSSATTLPGGEAPECLL